MWKSFYIHLQPAERHGERCNGRCRHSILKRNSSSLTATMCSTMAPLFRSWLEKRSLGNSCIAVERGNVTVTTHRQHDGEVTCPTRRRPGVPLLVQKSSYCLSLFVAPMGGVLFLLFLFQLFSPDYLTQQKGLGRQGTKTRSGQMQIN